MYKQQVHQQCDNLTNRNNRRAHTFTTG